MSSVQLPPRCWLVIAALLATYTVGNGRISHSVSAFQPALNGGSSTKQNHRQPIFLFSEQQQQQPSVQKKRISKVQKSTADTENIEESNDDGDAPRMKKSSAGSSMVSGKARWESLPTKAQETIRKAAQARAIANKKKREPAEEKKQRE